MFLTQTKKRKKKSHVSALKKKTKYTGGGRKCFMCNSRTKRGISVHSQTAASQVRYHQILSKLATGGDIVFLIDDDGVICDYCQKLVDCLDRYESEINVIDNIVKNSLYRNYKLATPEDVGNSVLQRMTPNDIDFKKGETVKVSTGPYMLPEELFEEKKAVRKSVTKASKSKANSEDGPPRKRPKKELKLSDSESDDTDFCQIIESVSNGPPKTIIKPPTSDQPSYKCSICFYETKYQSLMIFHLRQHLNSSDLRCDFCNIYINNNIDVSKEKDKKHCDKHEKDKKHCDKDMESLEKALNDTCNQFLEERDKSLTDKSSSFKDIEQNNLFAKSLDLVSNTDSVSPNKSEKTGKIISKKSSEGSKEKSVNNNQNSDKNVNEISEKKLYDVSKIKVNTTSPSAMMKKKSAGNVTQNINASVNAAEKKNDDLHSIPGTNKEKVTLKRKLPVATKCVTRGKKIDILKKMKILSPRKMYTKNKLISPTSKNNLKLKNTKILAGKLLKAKGTVPTEKKVLNLKTKLISPKRNLKVKDIVLQKRKMASLKKNTVTTKTKKIISSKINSTQNVTKVSPKKLKASLKNDANTSKIETKSGTSKVPFTTSKKHSVVKVSTQTKQAPKVSSEKNKAIPATQKIKSGTKTGLTAKPKLGRPIKSVTKPKLVVAKSIKKTKLTQDSPTKKTKLILKTSDKGKVPKTTKHLLNNSTRKAKLVSKKVPTSVVKNVIAGHSKAGKVVSPKRILNTGSKKIKLSSVNEKNKASLTKKHDQNNQVKDIMEVNKKVPLLKLEKLKLENHNL